MLFRSPEVSWKNKYIGGDPINGHKKIKILGWEINYPDALSDAWHIAKVIREGFNILAIVTAALICCISMSYLQILLYIVVLSICRNNAFNIFWDKILVRKVGKLK